MRMEKISENKIRIFFDMKDLIEKNIDLHTFMSNSMETQDLFLDMLEKAETELGFSTKNYKLIIEALASSDGNFIITVTRILPKNAEVTKKNKKTVKAKMKSVVPNNISSTVAFANFDDFCSFCTYIKNNKTFEKINMKSAYLFYYNDTYYLILNNIKLTPTEVKLLYISLPEFGSFVKNSTIFDRKIKEYGKVIFKKDAINECIKFFC